MSGLQNEVRLYFKTICGRVNFAVGQNHTRSFRKKLLGITMQDGHCQMAWTLDNTIKVPAVLCACMSAVMLQRLLLYL